MFNNHTVKRFALLLKRSRERLEKPEHLLPFVGALIVFVSFVVNEGIRDSLRDFTQTLQLAESSFQLRDASEQDAKELSEIEKTLTRILVNTEAGKVSNDVMKNQEEGQFLESVTVLRKHFEEELDALERLMEKLPGGIESDPSMKKYSALRSRMLMDDFEFIPNGDLGNGRRAESLHDYDLKLERELLPAERDLRVVAEIKLAWAKRLREQREVWLTISRYVSYLLFAVGWCLGLLGTLNGVEGVASNIE